jgi:hypothetical protein
MRRAYFRGKSKIPAMHRDTASSYVKAEVWVETRWLGPNLVAEGISNRMILPVFWARDFS